MFLYACWMLICVYLAEMKKFHMVLVHFYAPFSEKPKEKKEFATAASTFVDKAGRKLNFGHMSQVVEEKDANHEPKVK